MSPEHRRLRKELLIENNGTVDTQKANLVAFILALFTDPDKWPATDMERCGALRQIYRRAQIIRETERAIKEV